MELSSPPPRAAAENDHWGVVQNIRACMCVHYLTFQFLENVTNRI